MTSVFTLAEIEEQIAIRKEALKSMRQSYGITPAGGGASRNATNIDRAQVWRELQALVEMRDEMNGTGTARRRGPRTSHATFDGSGCTIGGGDPYP